ncbi:MAG: hypothetical protein RLO81_01495 [Fulvivirga sp.]|uniref:hypothetical protein n=1 Tax=Fulvivirga sp. TaxID=1931237 RepID=UPI0032EBF288
MMKNIFKYTFLGLSLMFLASCEDEDTQRIPIDELGNGPNVRVVIDPNNSFLDFDNINSAVFKYTVYTESTDLQLVQFNVSFIPFATGVAVDTLLIEEWTLADFTGGSISVEYSSNQLATLFGLSGAGDLEGGDTFAFTNTTTMNDGRVYPSPTVGGNINVTPNIVQSAATTSFTSNFSTFVGCPSQIPVGNFTMIFNGSFCDPPCGFENPGASPATDLVYEGVAITRVGPVAYQVSQVDQPVEAIYSGIGYTGFSNTGAIQDICGVLQGTFGTQFVATGFQPIIQPSSTFDNGAGTITIDFITGFGGSGTYEFVPN